MLFALTIAAIMLALRCFPDAIVSKIVASKLIQPVAALLMKVERRHILFFLLFAAVIMFAGELLALGGPLDAGLIVLWDVATYVDILSVLAVAGATSRCLAAWRAVKARISRSRMRQARPRTNRARAVRRRSERAAPPANDDDQDADGAVQWVRAA